MQKFFFRIPGVPQKAPRPAAQKHKVSDTGENRVEISNYLWYDNTGALSDFPSAPHPTDTRSTAFTGGTVYELPMVSLPGLRPGRGGIFAHLQLRTPVPVPEFLRPAQRRERGTVLRCAPALGHPHFRLYLLLDGHPRHDPGVLPRHRRPGQAHRRDTPTSTPPGAPGHPGHPAPVPHPAYQGHGGTALL